MFAFYVLSLILPLFTIAPTLAKPLYLINRDSVSPPITYPTAGTVWTVGETRTITWYVHCSDAATAAYSSDSTQGCYHFERCSAVESSGQSLSRRVVC